ncbi:N-formylglutamate amidohydrolase [Methylocella tundrae]|uniref:N-formylglutamate amidohydrolase n=1 Tax=Methylocella tundrae TaxID=227605 RepID=A0A8B6M2R7_METTU|nr:N-formylglutamate amidohydrolase [Methylocella tundrae]VTZ49136.1 N-formylglutamate amidohydrolase [Methylocella tundrae]
MISEPPGQRGDIEPELDPGFEVSEPQALTSALVFSSPHSGDVYPRRFLQRTRLNSLQLRRSEDAFVDALFNGCVALGAPMIRALFPRTYLDLNREPYELDPRMFEGRLPAFANTRSIRVAGGLGTIPRVVGQAQEIYAGRLPLEEGLRRIDKLHKPYHARLSALIDRAQLNFGLAVLVDCHSMPSAVSPAGGLFSSHGREAMAGAPKQKADFVLGDRHGASCATVLVDVVEAELRSQGFSVARNKPYAGGYITENYGAPAANRHALQIEVSRGLYMDEHNVVRSERFEEVRAAMTRVAAALAETVASRLVVLRDAAE